MSKQRWWLLLLILIAFTLRLTLLGQQSLWYDEGVTWLLSQMRTLSDLITWTAADIQPPLYYLLIWNTDLIFGASEWALRFPSALFNTLTVPLIYALACRFSVVRERFFPFLTVILFTFSPLMVYYSQEARMYTMLVFEATLASYLLFRILAHQVEPQSSPKNYILPVVYALTIASALYTHYFAAFLGIVHALYLLIVLWQRNWSKFLLLQILTMFGLSALLFIPWLPTLLSRLGDDPSYWPGALKLDEVIRKVFISFNTGETVFEQTGLNLTLITLTCLIFLLILELSLKQGPSSWPNPAGKAQNVPFRKTPLAQSQSYVFLSLWLLLPIGLILLLSYQSPKFNPRYTLIAYPAYISILAAVLARFRGVTSDLASTQIRPRWTALTQFIVPVAVLFIVATSAFSLYNWFTDRRFSKDDFRALAQFVRERQADDETVLLSSGHMFPVWAYYYGWDNWTPLPWMQRLDVNQVTDLSIASQMAEAVAGKGGVWLVSWQDEVIDPNGIVPFWLDLIGQRPVDAGDFWGVGLEHWRLEPDELGRLQETPIERMRDLNFAGQVNLIGSTQLANDDLALFWQPRQTLPDDLVLSLDLTDSDGHDWDRETVTGQLGTPFYPPSRWPVGKIVVTRHQLAWQTGSPPGLYVAEIGLGQNSVVSEAGTTASAISSFRGWDILDEQGRPQRRTALLDFINLSHLVQPSAGPLPIAEDPLVDFLPIVSVRRSILPQESVEPGDRILLALVWQAGEFNLDNISVTFEMVDAANETFFIGNSYTPSREYNLPTWKPGDLVLGQYWLDIPPNVAPGPASLQLHLINVSGFRYDEVFTFDKIEILPTERNFTPPASVTVPLEANFSDQATLLGLDCQAAKNATCRASAGASLPLTLYWRNDAPLETNYTVFTHLLGADETVLVNADHAPPKPTQGWVPGEIIADPVSLTLPADLAPGTYAVEIGFYDAADPTFSRLPLTNGEMRLLLPDLLRVE